MALLTVCTTVPQSHIRPNDTKSKPIDEPHYVDINK